MKNAENPQNSSYIGARGGSPPARRPATSLTPACLFAQKPLFCFNLGETIDH
jgi:hypothetical protein